MNQETNEDIDMEVKEYDKYDTKNISIFMQYINIGNNQTKIAGVCNTNTFSLNKGILKFGQKGKQAVNKELSQLRNKEVFKPVMISQLTKEENQKATSSLIFLTEKRDGTIKVRACANVGTQRSYINKEEAASPTVSTEALLTTAVIDAK